jgi:hypothetical protein
LPEEKDGTADMGRDGTALNFIVGRCKFSLPFLEGVYLN